MAEVKGSDDADSAPASTTDAKANDQAVRSKITVLLGDAVEDPSPLYDLGRAIESELFRTHGASDTNSGEYRSKARSIAFNLRRNAALRERVRSEELTPAELCALSPDDLATDDLKRRRARMEERATRKRTRGAMDAAFKTDRYTCGECSSKNCSYMQVNGHRDIGKNETWGSKDSQADDGRVLVRCHECGAEWNQVVL